MMTTKDYKAIAQIIITTRSPVFYGYMNVAVLISALSDYLELDNPCFNPKEFKKACYPNDK